LNLEIPLEGAIIAPSSGISGFKLISNLQMVAIFDQIGIVEVGGGLRRQQLGWRP
jgi:hypothetical protein